MRSVCIFFPLLQKINPNTKNIHSRFLEYKVEFDQNNSKLAALKWFLRLIFPSNFKFQITILPFTTTLRYAGCGRNWGGGVVGLCRRPIFQIVISSIPCQPLHSHLVFFCLLYYLLDFDIYLEYSNN